MIVSPWRDPASVPLEYDTRRWERPMVYPSANIAARGSLIGDSIPAVAAEVVFFGGRAHFDTFYVDAAGPIRRVGV